MNVCALTTIVAFLVLVVSGTVAAAAPTVTTTNQVTGAANPLETRPLAADRQLAVEAADTRTKSADVGTERPRALPVYTPPRRGAPKTRVGGGTRQLSGDAVELTVLAPPHTGLTQAASPTLYWFLSGRSAGPFEFVVTTPDAAEPLWRERVDGPLEAGIHAVTLHEHDVELTRGVEYQWSVAIVRDPERRSRDIVTLGTVERTGDGVAEGPGENRRAVSQQGPDDVTALAERGLWYDALQTLTELSARSPDRTLDDFRMALLDQAELEEVAQWLRSHQHGPIGHNQLLIRTYVDQ